MKQKQIFIGLITEGPTDIRFLSGIINRTVQEIAIQCENEIEVSDVQNIYAQGDSFVEKMLNASHTACEKYSISLLFIHADADNRKLDDVMTAKFAPLQKALVSKDDDNYCKHIVPTVPIQMIESWMMADKQLLKRLINAEYISNIKLGLERMPETYADPKSVIENAIRQSLSTMPKKRRNQIRISDLYEILGNSLDLNSLRALPSFQNFEQNISQAFIDMHLIQQRK